MFKWIKRVFCSPEKPICEHDFIITERPVTVKRWEDDFSYSSEVQAMEHGHWVYRKTTETDYFCKKCAFHTTVRH